MTRGAILLSALPLAIGFVPLLSQANRRQLLRDVQRPTAAHGAISRTTTAGANGRFEIGGLALGRPRFMTICGA